MPFVVREPRRLMPRDAECGVELFLSRSRNASATRPTMLVRSHD